MKRHKVDPNNLPKEEVLAINDKGEMMTGIIVAQGIGIYCVKDKNVLPVITHYILKSEQKIIISEGCYGIDILREVSPPLHELLTKIQGK